MNKFDYGVARSGPTGCTMTAHFREDPQNHPGAQSASLKGKLALVDFPTLVIRYQWSKNTTTAFACTLRSANQQRS